MSASTPSAVGLTANTPKHFLLDAGAFYKNFEKTTGSGTLIGATAGGGSFSAVPQIRKIELDGAKQNVKGLMDVDQWAVTMVANVKEITADSLKLALGMASESSGTITGKAHIESSDYIDNITWVGRISGSSTPVIIIVKNAISQNGLSMSFADKSEATISVTMTGCYAIDDLETPPFEIIYPTIA